MFYPGETVRLLRELPEAQLAKHTEGTVVRVLHTEEGRLTAAEVKFYKNSTALIAAVPADGIEFVISSALQDRAAVLWGLKKSGPSAVEASMRFMLDHGFLMREGLNAAVLLYDSQDKWWKWGDRFSDPSGEHVVSSAASCDGCVVAFGGSEQFQLEFRLRGARGPVLLLHERDAMYGEQACRTAPAMSLVRVLMNLCEAADAEYCAFPVADPWLRDEDWRSLLREPLYPDFFCFLKQNFQASFQSLSEQQSSRRGALC